MKLHLPLHNVLLWEHESKYLPSPPKSMGSGFIGHQISQKIKWECFPFPPERLFITKSPSYSSVSGTCYSFCWFLSSSWRPPWVTAIQCVKAATVTLSGKELVVFPSTKCMEPEQNRALIPTAQGQVSILLWTSLPCFSRH